LPATQLKRDWVGVEYAVKGSRNGPRTGGLVGRAWLGLAGFGPSGGILNGLGPSRLLLDFGGELMMMNTRGPEMGFRASAFGDDGGID
jgi:hypothetical protein